jgi:hypothetical protein
MNGINPLRTPVLSQPAILDVPSVRRIINAIPRCFAPVVSVGVALGRNQIVW